MDFNINEESRMFKRATERKYGSLTVETTIKNDKGVIDLTSPLRKSNSVKDEVAASKVTGVNKNTGINYDTKYDVKKSPEIFTTDSIELKRGQKISLNVISKLLIALDWNINHTGSHEFDLDTSIFMVDVNGNTKEENFIFYGNPKGKDGAVILGEDYNTGIKDYYDRTLQVDLMRISKEIEKFAITVTIYEGEERGQNFSKISNGYFRIIDVQDKSEKFSFKFSDGLRTETAVVVAEIYRYKNQWKINPIGNGFNGGLEALCENYGIETQ